MTMTEVWLLLDPQTNRVSIQTTEPSDSSFPPGPRGVGWKVRQGRIDSEVWAGVLSGQLPDDEVDRVHRELWTESGDTAWPNG